MAVWKVREATVSHCCDVLQCPAISDQFEVIISGVWRSEKDKIDQDQSRKYKYNEWDSVTDWNSSAGDRVEF